MVRGKEPRPEPRSLQTEEEEELLDPSEVDQENQEDTQKIGDLLTAELISWSNKGGQWGAGPAEGGVRHWSVWVKSSLMD